MCNRMRALAIGWLSVGAMVADCARSAPPERVCTDDGSECLTDDDCSPGARCIAAGDVVLRTILEPLGSISQRAYPGGEIPLKVAVYRSAGDKISSEEHLAPLPGEVVTWSLVGAPAPASVSAATTLTNAEGIANVSVDVGTTPSAAFQVRVEVSGAEAITFSVTVLADTRALRLLTPSPLDTVVDRVERIRVRLVRPQLGGLDAPVAGEPVQVELVGGARDGAALLDDVGDVVSVLTDASGIATVRFATGTVDQDYELVFCGDLSCPQTPAASFTVAVQLRGNVGPCQYFTDCEPGYVCVEGACELGATYCAEDDDCPTGYVCGAGRLCELAGPGPGCTETSECEPGKICSDAGNCIEEEGCQGLSDCPVGWTCDLASGACLPDANPTDPVVDVRGDWVTRYQLDLSDALPGFFTDGLGPVVDFLDLVFRSQLEIDVPIVGDILEAALDALIAEYVPSWVPTLVTILADFIHVFESMEVDGEMTLYQPGTPLGVQVSGEESWEGAQFFIASLCPGGVQQFEEDHACGAVDVVVHPEIDLGYSNNDPDVGVNVSPFTGQVQPPASGELLSRLLLFNREIEMELRQLLNVLLDVIVLVASDGQWYDFEEFLIDVIPCEELQLAIDDIACDLTDGDICSVPGIELACVAAATQATVALTDALGDVGLNVLSLEFDAQARIHDDGDAVAPRAEVLGDPNDPPSESAIDGDLQAVVVFSGALDGSWWFGERP